MICGFSHRNTSADQPPFYLPRRIHSGAKNPLVPLEGVWDLVKSDVQCRYAEHCVYSIPKKRISAPAVKGLAQLWNVVLASKLTSSTRMKDPGTMDVRFHMTHTWQGCFAMIQLGLRTFLSILRWNEYPTYPTSASLWKSGRPSVVLASPSAPLRDTNFPGDWSQV